MAGYRNTPSGLRDTAGYSILQNQLLHYSLAVNPSYRHFFGTRYSVETSYSFIDEDYHTLDDYDNRTHMALIQPSVYFGGKTHALSASYTYSDHDAEAEFASFTSNGLGVSYSTEAILGADVSLTYTHSERSYGAKPLLFAEEREDRRDVISVRIGYRFPKNISASLDYTYLKNHSNADLYEFDKNIVALNVGLAF